MEVDTLSLLRDLNEIEMNLSTCLHTHYFQRFIIINSRFSTVGCSGAIWAETEELVAGKKLKSC